MGGMEIVLPLFVLALIGLGVWFWVWLYRWATDVRDSLRRIADQGRPVQRQRSST